MLYIFVFTYIFMQGRGFHVRFADIARGGIRLIKSASAQVSNDAS